MANYDNPRGFWPAQPITPVEYLCKTGETVAIGDIMIPDGVNGMSLAVYTDGELWRGGVVCPQEDEDGDFISAQAANLYTTSTAAVKVKLWPFVNPDSGQPNHFYAQDDGTPAAGYENLACDITGTTGAMQLNSAATTEQVLQIVDLCVGDMINLDSSGKVVPNELGANQIVKVRAVVARAI